MACPADFIGNRSQVGTALDEHDHSLLPAILLILLRGFQRAEPMARQLGATLKSSEGNGRQSEISMHGKDLKPGTLAATRKQLGLKD